MYRFLQSSRYSGVIAILLTINLTACKKFVETSPPPTEIAGATVYSNNSSAAAVMTGLYSDMIQNSGFSSGTLSIGWFMGLAADELTNYDPTNSEQVQFYQNALSSYSNGISNYYFWTELYSDIYVTNAILEGLTNSSAVTDSVKRQLSGEAEFMRAFLHFYATNLYGDVPLVTTTNYQLNNTISRTPQTQVYQQIVADLLDAQSKLSPAFVDGLGNPAIDRIRPNQGAAMALLARVYLYTEKWDSAEASATAVINNSALYSLDSVNNVFLANSTEAIWQLEPNQPGYNTYDALDYVLQGDPGPGQQNSVAVSSNLTNVFEANDERFANWLGVFTDNNNVNYYYPYKYKVWQNGAPLTEYTMVLRLAEQYLIRAEAEANLGDSTDAINDLNVIRNRAALPNYTSLANGPLLSAILHERQVELFTEWGHRWLDLKRTANLNSVMGAPGNVCSAKGGIWNADWALLPIALQELKINPHLAPQNPGY
jgi:starch-binding outer membrane protein, SusD/RagB family